MSARVLSHSFTWLPRMLPNMCALPKAEIEHHTGEPNTQQ